MTVIETINGLGYTIEKRDDIGAVNIINPEGNKKAFTFSRELDRILYFGTERISVSEKELFNELHHPTEEEMSQFLFGCSVKTHEYIDAVKQKIGFVGVSTESDMLPKKLYGKETEFYHTDIHSGIDDWCEYRYYFTHKPSSKDIAQAKEIELFEFDLRIGRVKEEFKCWECGNKVHFLDIPGDISTKIECIRDKYCGC